MAGTDEAASQLSVALPSIADHLTALCEGRSYVHYSAVPPVLQHVSSATTTTTTTTTTTWETTASDDHTGPPCVLGIDEAGRGPVIGPMVYGTFYLPLDLHHSLLAETHHFDDSKVLTPEVRANLMRKVCTTGTNLYEQCGWAIKSLSAQDIGAGMLKNGGSYNLNAQAMDATVEIIRGVIDRGVNVREIYVDTIGQPAVYQKKLERIFPTISITVEKKADSLFPCVSAASVVAKVTRDVSCEVLYEEYLRSRRPHESNGDMASWGSGYPSDSKCVSWLKNALDPVFGWGSECRFSWGTVKDLLEVKGGSAVAVDWPADDEDDDNMKVSQYFGGNHADSNSQDSELRNWFGRSTGQEIF